MIYEPSNLAVFVFSAFVLGTVGLSFYLGRKARDSKGYFAAHGQIPWAVNGVAFAGDYLSAASFLGICGMIAAYGYDGFLYSIGFLAGWIVALFVIAEPMKRLGKFTFADALDAKFDSRGIKGAAGISTLIVSVFYLIPQMVGAGSLIKPLLGYPHWVGVVMVGVVVILIVVTAGMVSTTWVQFLKGSLLVIFSFVLVVMLLSRGFDVIENPYGDLGEQPVAAIASGSIEGRAVLGEPDGWPDNYVRLPGDVGFELYKVETTDDASIVYLRRAQSVTERNGELFVDGAALGSDEQQNSLTPVGHIASLRDGKTSTGAVGPVEFFGELADAQIILFGSEKVSHADGGRTTIYYQKPTSGDRVLRPGEHPKFAGIRGDNLIDKLNFVSLMLALFCGTASLPHILIRYYTVKDGAAARKSTILGITTIGFFYVLTLYLGLGAMTSGELDLMDFNMSAPLLARSMSPLLFAIISAIAFTTVLGTVSGLILATSGAVAHDILAGVFGFDFDEKTQIRVAKFSAVVVGAIAIVLGILFKELNVGYLVGWAFSIAASANLPALVMLLFWKRTTRLGIIASVTIGALSSLGWILVSSDTYSKVYGWDAADAIAPFSQPGLVTIPLSFAVLIVVSLITPEPNQTAPTTAIT